MGKVVTVTLKADTKGVDRNLGKVDKSLRKTEKQAVKTGDAMENAISNVSPRIGGLINQIKSVGTSFKALAVGAGVGAIAGLGALFVTATKKGAEFAKQMSTLEAVSGASAIEMEKMAESAKELGASTQFTAKQVGELQTEFAKMGFTTDQILASTAATLDLAASMEVDLASSASLAGSTVNAFGLEAEDTQRVVDVLAMSTSSSALDFDSLRESLKLAAPAAKATGRTIEQTSAMLAVLADNGIKGSRAGTALTAAFIELNKKGLTLEQALSKIGKSSDQLGTAMDIAGKIGGRALLTLTGKEADIDRLTLSFENSAGAAERMAQIRLDNLAGDTTKLSSAWEGFLLSIEDGEGLFNSIARGIVQATTALLNFITPTTKLSEQLEKERIELFKTEAELDRLDEKMKDTTLSEDELKLVQNERVTIIKELKNEYPDLLKNIKEEEVSTKDLKKAIDEVNKSLINKIIIQEKEEEIMEQAEDSAEELTNLLEKEAETRDFVAKLQAEYTKLGLEFQETDPVKFQEELNDVIEREQQLLREGNGEGKLKIDQLSNLQKAQNNLLFKIKSVNKAEEDYQEELEKGNTLLDEKEALMKRLGITQEENIKKTNEESDLNKIIDEEQKTLIERQQELLAEAKKLPEFTEEELIIKNRKIKVINDEIKRLNALGIEQKKQQKKSVKEVEVTNELNKKLLEQIEIKEDLADLDLEEEEPVFETDFLKNTEKASKFQTEVKIRGIKDEIEQERQLRLQQLEWNKENIIKQSILDGTYNNEQKIAIEKDYQQKKGEIQQEAQDKYAQLRRQAIIDDLQLTVDTLNQASETIAGFAQMNQEKFEALNAGVIEQQQALGEAILANDKLTTYQKEQQLKQLNAVKEAEFNANNKRAEKAFNVQKKVAIASALITTFATAIQAFQSQFMPQPDPSSPLRGAIAAALATASGLLNVAQIKKQKFEAPTFTPVTLPSASSISGSGGGGGGSGGAGTSPSQAPQFNVVGQSGFNQVAGALGQQGPIQAFVVSGDVTTAQELENNTITQATF